MSRGFRFAGSLPARTRSVGLPLCLVIVLALGIMRPIPAAVPVARAAVHSPFGALLAHSRDLGRLAPSQRVSFLATLRDPSGARLNVGLAAIYDPHAPAFQHYWTAGQWAHHSALLQGRVAAAHSLLARAGLAASWRPGSDWLDISGPARVVERVFHVAIHTYISVLGRRFYASAHDPIIPSPLRRIVSGTGHISISVRLPPSHLSSPARWSTSRRSCSPASSLSLPGRRSLCELSSTGCSYPSSTPAPPV